MTGRLGVVTGVTHQDPTAASPAAGTDPVTALVDACRHFATHIDLLADQLGAARLSADDIEHVTDAVHGVFDAAGLAAGLTIGLQRHAIEEQCVHYTPLTDAEWAPLAEGANMRNTFYGCGLRPGHAGPHVAHVQALAAPPARQSHGGSQMSSGRRPVSMASSTATRTSRLVLASSSNRGRCSQGCRMISGGSSRPGSSSSGSCGTSLLKSTKSSGRPAAACQGGSARGCGRGPASA
ncbi:hypothetical protein ACQEUU_21465 [Nonomuraea sp. CA-218870]|uniref:hypothetical protein n=1 Tax=Nonomuraea sp. CA-218870 TaxID=3239998 RepID=UPI003D8AEB54